MKSRDRRALWFLGVWVVGLGLWTLGRAWWSHHEALLGRRASLTAFTAKETWLQGAYKEAQAKRQSLMTSARPVWLGLPEDQMRLRFQESLLSATQKAGLQEVRLRTLPSQDGALIWKVEAVASLPQWMDFVEGVGREGTPLDLRAVHWIVNGDPWSAQGAEGSEGPLLRGETEWGGATYPADSSGSK